MKKLLFVAVFVSLLAVPTGAQIVRAQTVEASVQVENMKATLIALLTQMIAELQAQITELIAKQAQTAETVATIQQNQTPVVFGATSEPESFSASLGSQVCEERFYYTYPDGFGGNSVKTSYSPRSFNAFFPIVANREWSNATVEYTTYLSQSNEPVIGSTRVESYSTTYADKRVKLPSNPKWLASNEVTLTVDGFAFPQAVTVSVCE